MRIRSEIPRVVLVHIREGIRREQELAELRAPQPAAGGHRRALHLNHRTALFQPVPDHILRLAEQTVRRPGCAGDKGQPLFLKAAPDHGNGFLVQFDIPRRRQIMVRTAFRPECPHRHQESIFLDIRQDAARTGGNDLSAAAADEGIQHRRSGRRADRRLHEADILTCFMQDINLNDMRDGHQLLRDFRLMAVRIVVHHITQKGKKTLFRKPQPPEAVIGR